MFESAGSGPMSGTMEEREEEKKKGKEGREED